MFAVAASLVLGSVARASDHDSTAEARAGIQKTIDQVNSLLKRNASAQEIAAVLYEDDLMITGEGDVYYSNLASFMGPLAEYVKDGSRCHETIVDPIRASGNLAVAFVLENCAAASAGDKEENYRIMFVFRNGPHGWRATMEHFSAGTFK